MQTYQRKKEQRKTAKISVLSLCLVLMVILTGCGSISKTSNYQNTGFAMGTVIAQNMYGGDEDIAEEILNVITELEQTISWRIDGTEVNQINDAAGKGQEVPVSEKLAGWLLDCLEVYHVSGGKLDVTVGPVARLWDIGGDNPRIPEEQELADAFEKVGADYLSVEKDKVLFSTEGGQLDLGAVGKGIGCDEIYDYILTNYPELNGTFSVGGSVLIYGKKPDGKPWKIGIRDPRGEEGEYMGSLTFACKEGGRINVSTSGDYEKYFEEDGVRYHHILDPATGAPAESDLISVTTISESGFLSDALSTACFVAGEEEALKLCDHFGAEAVFIRKDGKVVLTEGAEAYFELINKEYTLD